MPASQTGISFSNDLDPESPFNIFNYLYYYNGAGVAAADFNRDGLIDLYFTGNQTADRLYLNKGNFQFEDVTSLTAIDNTSGWTTGVTNVDINNDGLMDLYVCKVSELSDPRDHNRLYLNLGVDGNGVPKFKEQAEAFGLAFQGYSTQSAFFDYDLDGDLDMYLLNHSTHPNRNYGRGSKRNSVDAKSGDRLYENENGKFRDVSAEVGLHQGIIGYGLGISVGDLNADGFPDLYIGNDFFENDYVYINQQDKTFRDINAEEHGGIGHTTHFSMGNDIADVNNDGLPDILSLDMLPQDLETYKTSGLEHPYQTYSNYLKNGFNPQYMQNTLQLNNGSGFSETAFLSGIAASEWSWGALFADFDNDSFQDVYITNGIKGATNDMDYIRFISNEKIQKQLSQGENANFEKIIQELPEKKVPNCFFQNNGDHVFEDRNGEWIENISSFSHGFVYADLDNDGDLDLVVNNTDEEAFVYRNNMNSESTNFLDVELNGSANNINGIGAKVFIYTKGNLQFREHYLTRGYLSSLAPGLHFGLGKHKKIESLRIVWPDASSEILRSVAANQKLVLDYSNAVKAPSKPVRKENSNFLEPKDAVFDYVHEEQSSLEFNREVLIPYASTNLSPRCSVGDLNNDGLEDIVFGGGKSQQAEVYLQDLEGTFTKLENMIAGNAIAENTDQVIFDANGDGLNDILMVSGGNEFQKGAALKPRLYLQENSKFIEDSLAFQNIELNASRVKAVDFNNDGALDVAITADVVPGKFGEIPRQYLFLNNGKGQFSDVTQQFSEDFGSVGMVHDMEWIDLNQDGFLDVVLAGYWMPITILINEKGRSLRKLDSQLGNSNGWWNCIRVADFDQDGDLDLVAGNWGLNSRLEASVEQPLSLYLNDFDENGSKDPVITYFYKNEETPFASKDELDRQMPFLKKKFTTYQSYAQAEFSSIFPEEKLENASLRKVYELGSCYFENTGDLQFKKHRLGFEAQVSSVFDIAVEDFNGDGFPDLYLVGNNYEISTQLGRLDALHGALLLNNSEGAFKNSTNTPFLQGPARNIQKININGRPHLVVTFNGGKPVVLELNLSENEHKD
ncbi:MAG: VCBS repeat-containing protein [Bacteroidota bacterium]|nr:VCBS repeat-containing protein [Bacteroidota bacterium]